MLGLLLTFGVPLAVIIVHDIRLRRHNAKVR